LTSGSPATGSQVTSNTVPVAVNDTYARGTGLSMKIKISDLLTNDADADGDTLIYVNASSQTTNLQAVIDNGITSTCPPTTWPTSYLHRA